VHHRRLGRLRAGKESDNSASDFKPIALGELELSAPLQGFPPPERGQAEYCVFRAIVRLHSVPLGVLELGIAEDGVRPSACGEAAWEAFGPRINEHLREDGLPEATGIGPGGLPSAAAPRCLARREELLRSAPAASVIICTRNRAGSLAQSLRSLENQSYPEWELIVVDGSSSSDTRDLIRRDFPDVRYSHVGSNGLSVARNTGLASASGAIVAFTDDDVRVDPHWLVELVSAFEAGDRVACATGLVLPLELETPAQVWFEESGAFTEGFERRVVGLRRARPRGSLLPYATGRIGAGVSMAWRASILRELGGFDVAFDALTPPWPPNARHGSSGEDVAAFFDALVNDYEIVFEPRAVVYHEHRRTYEELKRQLYWHGIGLSAYLTRCLAREPARIPDFARRVPLGVVYGFAPGSPRNREKSPTFPSALTRAERLGVIHGPFAYLRGLPLTRRLRCVGNGAAQTAT
jgi:glycosyltransferase involved in cell wall biosynthesis